MSPLRDGARYKLTLATQLLTIHGPQSVSARCHAHLEGWTAEVVE